jgi:dTDP-4-dehydrorhamnose reductase
MEIFLNQYKPNCIINLVALTSVEDCENNSDLASNLNVLPVKNIVKWILKNNSNCHLIHISTDHVYDGPGYKKENEVNLLNNYARTKYISETIAQQVRATVLRTNFIGKSINSKRNSFTDWIYYMITQNKIIYAYSDILFNPVSIFTLNNIINYFIQNKYLGIYNIGSRGCLSKADFIENFTKLLKYDINNIKKVNYENNISRPKNMCMNIVNYENLSGIRMKNIIDEINIVTKEYLCGV